MAHNKCIIIIIKPSPKITHIRQIRLLNTGVTGTILGPNLIVKFSNISTKLVVSVCSNSELVLFVSYKVVKLFFLIFQVGPTKEVIRNDITFLISGLEKKCKHHIKCIFKLFPTVPV